LLVDYFDFHRPGYGGSARADLLFGTGGWGGFHPEHPRYAGLPLPWIYPPWQTWLYLACFGVLVWMALAAVAAIHRSPAYSEAVPTTRSLEETGHLRV
jgi:hypothetical protein